MYTPTAATVYTAEIMMTTTFFSPMTTSRENDNNEAAHQNARFACQYTAHITERGFSCIAADMNPHGSVWGARAATNILPEPIVQFQSDIINEQEAADAVTTQQQAAANVFL